MKTSNKQIQEERIKGYFIEATKKILKGEGLRSVNVRNISKEAGYSYATLYNYFKDVKELVFECIKDFTDECKEIVKIETINSKRVISKIKTITLSYIKFFVQYPGIFELFYLERISDLGYKNPSIDLVYSFLDELCDEEWTFCYNENILSRKEINYKKEALRNIVVGSLLFYINRNTPNTYDEFMTLVNKQINGLL